jgi:hypothetical protein
MEEMSIFYVFSQISSLPALGGEGAKLSVYMSLNSQRLAHD